MVAPRGTAMKPVAVLLLLLPVLLVACGRKPPPPKGGFAAWGTPRLAFGSFVGQLTPRGFVARDPRSGRAVAEVDMDEPSGIGTLSDGSVVAVGVIEVSTLTQEAVVVRPDATQPERFPLVTVLSEGSSRILPDVSSPQHFFLVARLATRIQLERYELAPMTVGSMRVLPVQVVSDVEGGMFTGPLSLPDGGFLYRRRTDLVRLVPGQPTRRVAGLEGDDRDVALAPSAQSIWVRNARGDIALMNLVGSGRGVRLRHSPSEGDFLAFAAGGDRVALLTGGGDDMRLTVDRSDGARLLEATVPWEAEGERVELLFSPDASMVAVGTGAHLAVWDVGEQLLTFGAR